jgi:cyclopropane-fatty-acyl-phospholipid synthase
MVSKGHEAGLMDRGASPRAIRRHYDVDDEFYQLWLDDTFTYSCAMWEGEQTLEAAQIRKMDFHADQAELSRGQRVLDIGCGWGSLLQRLVTHHGVGDAVGLTLSETQFKYVSRFNEPKIDVRLESWATHTPVKPYDAIICIGTIEHFARPEMSAEERVDAYGAFFRRSSRMLKPGGCLCFQTSAYGMGRFTTGAISAIFPESDLPRLAELTQAWERLFSIEALRNDREDYARTCRDWRARLSANRKDAVGRVGEDVVLHYDKFLDAAARGFDSHVFDLLRVKLRRTDLPG